MKLWSFYIPRARLAANRITPTTWGAVIAETLCDARATLASRHPEIDWQGIEVTLHEGPTAVILHVCDKDRLHP